MKSCVNQIEALFNQTDKKYIDMSLITEVSCADIMSTISELGLTWKTLTISEHGFQFKFQAEYRKKAEHNIPLIYFGEGGFKSKVIGGGCCYVICRN